MDYRQTKEKYQNTDDSKKIDFLMSLLRHLRTQQISKQTGIHSVVGTSHKLKDNVYKCEIHEGTTINHLEIQKDKLDYLFDFYLNELKEFNDTNEKTT